MSETSPASDAANMPTTPATPNRRNGPANPPVTPSRASTPSKPREMTQHPTDPAMFVTIGIHTAKCDVCNQRNACPRMLRCPECTWQICGPCRDGKNNNLAHGNVTPKPPTSNRKKLVGIAPFGPRRTASPLPAADPKAAVASAAKKVVNTKTTPASTVKQKLLAAAQEVTPPTSGEKRRLETKPTQHREPSEAGADDDNSDAEPLSPSVSRKRQKTAPPASSRVVAKGSREPQDKHVNVTPQRKVASADTPAQMSYLNINGDRERAEANAKAVEEYFGISGSAYKEHPLARPLTSMISTVRVPPNVQRNFAPRKGAAEIQRDIQEKVAKKLEQDFGWPASHGYASESTTPAEQKAIRDVVQGEATRLRKESLLNGEQLAIVVKAIQEAALKVRDNAVQQMAAPFRAAVAPGMDMELVHLNDVQLATLRGDVGKVVEQALKKSSASPNAVPAQVSDESLSKA